MNIIDLRKHLGLPDFVDDADTSSEAPSSTGSENTQVNSLSNSRVVRVRRQSMEQLDLIKVFVLFIYFLHRFSFCCFQFSLNWILISFLFLEEFAID